MQRSIDICRSWLFVEGANQQALKDAASSGADVLIQELEDFTPTELLPKARSLAQETYQNWRKAGAVVAVRINPFEKGGIDDLQAVMKGKPDIVALPKVSGPDDIRALEQAVLQCERDNNITPGTTRLLPNIESAKALVQTGEIARSSKRVIACLLASEDLAADIGAERLPDCSELAYARQRFLIECVAADTLAIDCPYTWSDKEGLYSDTQWAKRRGYKAKSAVALNHAAIINNALSPTSNEISNAQLMITAYQKAIQAGDARVELSGKLIEKPAISAALRLLQRAEQLGLS